MVCFRFCPIIKRDFAVLLAVQHNSHRQQQADVLEKQHQLQGVGGTHDTSSSAHKVRGRWTAWWCAGLHASTIQTVYQRHNLLQPCNVLPSVLHLLTPKA